MNATTMPDASSFFVAKVAFAKIMTAMAIGIGAIIADIALDARGFEDWSLKGILLASIIFVVRLLLKQQTDHKQEMRELRDRHENIITSVVSANTESNEKVCQLAEEQAQYFKAVTRNVLEERIREGPRKP